MHLPVFRALQRVPVSRKHSLCRGKLEKAQSALGRYPRIFRGNSNSNFLSGEGPRTLSPRRSGRWGSGIKVASGKTEDKDSRIKLEVK